MAIPPTPESTPTPGPTPPGPTPTPPPADLPPLAPPGPTSTAPPAPAPPPPLAGAPYAMPPGPLAARAPGQPTYYPQQAYYAPGWTAPAATSPRRSRRGLWLAIGGGLVILLVVGGAAVGVTRWMQTRTLGDVSGPTTANARQVDTGHCIADLPRDGEVARVELVPCSQPHEAEVVGLLTLQDESWPGQESVDNQVTGWCEMDGAQQEAGFQPVVWTPSQRGWGQGDRRGVCLAWLDGGGATGSFMDGDVQVG